MKNKSKVMYILLTIGMVVAFLTTAIHVFGAAKNNDTVNNRLHLPNVTGKIEEDFDAPTTTKIGEQVKKDVWVKNTGTAPLFVRVMVMPLIKSTEGVVLPLGIGDDLEIDLGSDWVDGGDGFYYYKGKVEPGKKTPSLFTKVTLSDSLEDEYVGADLSIQVKSETVTTQQYEYRKAWWRGETPSASPLKEVDELLASMRNGG